MPGPVPKRSSQRRRRNKVDIDNAAGALIVRQPAANRKWHSVARRWYEALARSGQATYYEPSDWATAYLIAESMSRDLNEQFVGFTEDGEVIREVLPLKGASLTAYLRAMSNLLVTEGDRRRLHLELDRPGAGEGEEDGADVSELADYRRRLDRSS